MEGYGKLCKRLPKPQKIVTWNGPWPLSCLQKLCTTYPHFSTTHQTTLTPTKQLLSIMSDSHSMAPRLSWSISRLDQAARDKNSIYAGMPNLSGNGGGVSGAGRLMMENDVFFFLRWLCFCWVSMHITIDVCVCIIDVPLGYACWPTLHVSLLWIGRVKYSHCF